MVMIGHDVNHAIANIPTHEKVSLVNFKGLFKINIVTLVCLGFECTKI
jgi:hypothetical protein